MTPETATLGSVEKDQTSVLVPPYPVPQTTQMALLNVTVPWPYRSLNWAFVDTDTQVFPSEDFQISL